MPSPHQKNLEAYLLQYIADASAFQKSVKKKIVGLKDGSSASSSTDVSVSKDSGSVVQAKKQSESSVKISRSESRTESRTEIHTSKTTKTVTRKVVTSDGRTTVTEHSEHSEHESSSYSVKVEKVLVSLKTITDRKTWVKEASRIIKTLGEMEETDAGIAIKKLETSITVIKKLKISHFQDDLKEIQSKWSQLRLVKDSDDIEDLQEDIQSDLKDLNKVKVKLEVDVTLSAFLLQITEIISSYELILKQISTRTSTGEDHSEEDHSEEDLSEEDLSGEDLSGEDDGTVIQNTVIQNNVIDNEVVDNEVSYTKLTTKLTSISKITTINIWITQSTVVLNELSTWIDTVGDHESIEQARAARDALTKGIEAVSKLTGFSSELVSHRTTHGSIKGNPERSQIDALTSKVKDLLSRLIVVQDTIIGLSKLSIEVVIFTGVVEATATLREQVEALLAELDELKPSDREREEAEVAYAAILTAISGLSLVTELSVWREKTTAIQARITDWTKTNDALSEPLDTEALDDLIPALEAGMKVTLEDITGELASMETMVTLLAEAPDQLQLTGLQGRISETIGLINTRQDELYAIGKPMHGIGSALNELKLSAAELSEKCQSLAAGTTNQTDTNQTDTNQTDTGQLDKVTAELTAQLTTIQTGMTSLVTISEHSAWTQTATKLTVSIEAWLKHYGSNPVSALSDKLTILTGWLGALKTGLAVVVDVTTIVTEVSTLITTETTDGGRADELIAEADTLNQQITSLTERFESIDIEIAIFKTIVTTITELTVAISNRVTVLEEIKAAAEERGNLREDLEDRYLTIQTELEALDGLNDLSQWGADAASLISLIDTWLSLSATADGLELSEESSSLRTWRGGITGGMKTVAALSIITSTRDELAAETDITTAQQATALLKRATDLQITLDGYAASLLIQQDAAPVYKALLKWLEMEGIEIEREKERFQELADDLSDGGGSGEEYAALKQKVETLIGAVNREGEADAWERSASALQSSLDSLGTWHSEHGGADPFEGLSEQLKACMAQVSELPSIYSSYSRLKDRAEGLSLDVTEISTLQGELRSLTTSLSDHIKSLGKLNQPTALVTAVLAAATHASGLIGTLSTTLSTTLTSATSHAELLKRISAEHEKILKELTALAQVSAPDAWQNRVTSLLTLIAEWVTLNGQRKDGITPDDADSLDDERQALQDATEWVASLISIEERISRQEAACQTQTSALVVEKIEEILSALDELEADTDTSRASLEPFARRLQLHSSLAGILGRTSALKTRIEKTRTQAESLLEKAKKAAEDREVTAELLALFGEIETAARALARIESVDIWRSDATALITLIEKWEAGNDSLSTGQANRLALLTVQKTVLRKGSSLIVTQETLRASIATLAEEVLALTTLTTTQATELRTRIKTAQTSIHTETEALKQGGTGAIGEPFARFIALLLEQTATLTRLEEALRKLEDAESERTEALAVIKARLEGVFAKIEAAMAALNGEAKFQQWPSDARSLLSLLSEWETTNAELGTAGDAAMLQTIKTWTVTVNVGITVCGNLDGVAANYDGITGQIASLGDAPTTEVLSTLIERLTTARTDLTTYTGQIRNISSKAAIFTAILANCERLSTRITDRITALEERRVAITKLAVQIEARSGIYAKIEAAMAAQDRLTLSDWPGGATTLLALLTEWKTINTGLAERGDAVMLKQIEIWSVTVSTAVTVCTNLTTISSRLNGLGGEVQGLSGTESTAALSALLGKLTTLRSDLEGYANQIVNISSKATIFTALIQGNRTQDDDIAALITRVTEALEREKARAEELTRDHDEIIRRLSVLKSTTSGDAHARLGGEVIALIGRWLKQVRERATTDARAAALEGEQAALSGVSEIIAQVDEFITLGRTALERARGSEALTVIEDILIVSQTKLQVAIRELERAVTTHDVFLGLLGVLRPLLDAVEQQLRDIAERSERERQEAITIQTLDGDVLELTTLLEMLPPIASGESWATAAERARLKAVSWLTLHKTLKSTHARAAWVESWPPLLEIGIDKAPRLSVIESELDKHRQTCTALEGSPDAAQITVLISTLAAILERLSVVRVNIELIDGQAKKPAIVRGLLKHLDEAESSTRALSSRAAGIDLSQGNQQQQGTAEVEKDTLTPAQMRAAVNRIWNWYERALAPRAARKEIIKEGKKSYDINALWKELRNTKPLKQDLDALLEWTRKKLPAELRNEGTVQTMIKDAQKNG